MILAVHGLADHERRRDAGLLTPGTTTATLVPTLVEATLAVLAAPAPAAVPVSEPPSTSITRPRTVDIGGSPEVTA